MLWFRTILLTFAAYLCGSLPSGYWVGRWVAGVDVRTMGSKNIGATNVARTLGLPWGFLVLILDMAKGALPVFTALYLGGGEVQQKVLPIVLVALAALFGHLWSPFLRFCGGKGVALSLPP